MKFIQFNPKNFDMAVSSSRRSGVLNIRVASPGLDVETFYEGIHAAPMIYWEVLYPAVEAEDKRKGVKGVAYSLVPPDPWLVALGAVMWEGIVQGFAWDALKGLVNAALAKLRRHGVAPKSEDDAVTTNERRELGFCWTNYVNGQKQYQMFIGLRKVYHREIRRISNDKTRTPRKRRTK